MNTNYPSTMKANHNQSNHLTEADLHYKESSFSTSAPLDFIKNNIESILTRENISKYFSDADIHKLVPLLPKSTNNNTMSNIKRIIDPQNKNIKFLTPLKLFKTMLNNNFFSAGYQANLETLRIKGIEEYISCMEKKLRHLTTNKDNYLQVLNASINDGELSNEEVFLPLPKLEDYSLSSGYTTLSEGEVSEDHEDNSFTEKKDKSISVEGEGSLSDERFKNLKMNKNQLTIRPRSEEEVEVYHKAEHERYKNPHLPWTYYDLETKASVVAPVLKKMPSGTSNKPRDHFLLKSDRPSYVTILCLARDAASRMPEGVGTRADICDLLKDSQYINERLSDAHLNNIVSGALDRLHYEKDPCVKYDLQKKLWIYLHKNRPVDFAPWNEHLKPDDNKEVATNLSSSKVGKSDKADAKHLVKERIITTPVKKKNGEKNFLKIKRKHS